MTLHAADRDPAADPGVDIYQFANGGWLERHTIPAGFGAWGSFEEIHVRNEAVLRDLLERAAAGATSDVERLIGDAYAAGMDTAAVEAAGLGALRPHLEAAAAVSSLDDVLALLPQLHRDGIDAFFAAGTSVDHDDASAHLFWLIPAGLGLPDRDSYTDGSDAAAALREAYVAHLQRQLHHAGWQADEALARDVLALETRLAEQQLRAEERRDPGRILNRRAVAELDAVAADLALPAYLEALGAGSAREVNLAHPPFFSALPGIIATTDVATLRAYLAFHVVASYASSLPAAVEDEAFDFYGRRIEGKTEPKERYQRVVAALGADMGEALGHGYVAATFPPEAKARALTMVEAILAEMRASLRTRAWMTDATREQGLAKLDTLRVKIGYPDVWRDWSGLAVARESYCANRIAAARFEFDRQLRQLDEPVDVDEWAMPPHAVNAYYHPLRNEIVFPAGILSPPMFDADADDAVNFGGIGTVIAHEITHAFDDSGRRFDAAGAFRDWWTREDEEHFTALTEALVAQFDGYEALPGVPVNGRLTLGENIADLGGVTLAHRALQGVLRGDEELVDGLTPAQRFFLANATIWRAHTSEELARTLAQTDPHSPRRLRVVGPFSNLDAFAAAFGLDDDAPVMRPPAQRLEIW